MFSNVRRGVIAIFKKIKWILIDEPDITITTELNVDAIEHLAPKIKKYLKDNANADK